MFSHRPHSFLGVFHSFNSDPTHPASTVGCRTSEGTSQSAESGETGRGSPPTNLTEPANQGGRRWTSLPFRWTPNLRKCDRRNSTTAPLPPSSLPSIAARIASSHLPKRRRKSFLPHSPLPPAKLRSEREKKIPLKIPPARSKDPSSSCPPLHSVFPPPLPTAESISLSSAEAAPSCCGRGLAPFSSGLDRERERKRDPRPRPLSPAALFHYYVH